jgi:hypothetical protein
VKLFDSRMMATFDNRRASCSTIAFTKCVVPIVRHAILFLSIADCSSTMRTAASMPSVTLGLVVGVLCCARTPRSGVLDNEGSSTTASLEYDQQLIQNQCGQGEVTCSSLQRRHRYAASSAQPNCPSCECFT